MYAIWYFAQECDLGSQTTLFWEVKTKEIERHSPAWLTGVDAADPVACVGIRSRYLPPTTTSTTTSAATNTRSHLRSCLQNTFAHPSLLLRFLCACNCSSATVLQRSRFPGGRSCRVSRSSSALATARQVASSPLLPCSQCAMVCSCKTFVFINPTAM